eukprot:scaffold1183_cov418-Prasinococcus_capsulatus_cf.AAC.9
MAFPLVVECSKPCKTRPIEAFTSRTASMHISCGIAPRSCTNPWSGAEQHEQRFNLDSARAAFVCTTAVPAARAPSFVPGPCSTQYT